MDKTEETTKQLTKGASTTRVNKTIKWCALHHLSPSNSFCVAAFVAFKTWSEKHLKTVSSKFRARHSACTSSRSPDTDLSRLVSGTAVLQQHSPPCWAGREASYGAAGETSLACWQLDCRGSQRDRFRPNSCCSFKYISSSCTSMRGLKSRTGWSFIAQLTQTNNSY